MSEGSFLPSPNRGSPGVRSGNQEENRSLIALQFRSGHKATGAETPVSLVSLRSHRSIHRQSTTIAVSLNQTIPEKQYPATTASAFRETGDSCSQRFAKPCAARRSALCQSRVAQGKSPGCKASGKCNGPAAPKAPWDRQKARCSRTMKPAYAHGDSRLAIRGYGRKAVAQSRVSLCAVGKACLRATVPIESPLASFSQVLLIAAARDILRLPNETVYMHRNAGGR